MLMPFFRTSICFTGMTSDSVKHYLKYPRSFCLSIVSLLFIVTQLFAISIQRVEMLSIASAMLGLSYGGIFGVFLTLFIDWFGLRKPFSSNVGWFFPH
jgi:MFS family permease